MNNSTKDDRTKRIGALAAAVAAPPLVAAGLSAEALRRLRSAPATQEGPRVVKDVAGRVVPVWKPPRRAPKIPAYASGIDVLVGMDRAPIEAWAHEAGHAKGARGLKGALRGLSYHGGHSALLAAPLLALTGADEDKRGNKAAVLGALGAAGVLGEEGRAWVHGYRGLKRLGLSARDLRRVRGNAALALAAYGALALGSGVVSPLLISKIRENKAKEQTKQAAETSTLDKLRLRMANASLNPKRTPAETATREATVTGLVLGTAAARALPAFYTRKALGLKPSKGALTALAIVEGTAAVGKAALTYGLMRQRRSPASKDYQRVIKYDIERRAGRDVPKPEIKSTKGELIAAARRGGVLRSLVLSPFGSLAVLPAAVAGSELAANKVGDILRAHNIKTAAPLLGYVRPAAKRLHTLQSLGGRAASAYHSNEDKFETVYSKRMQPYIPQLDDE